MSSSAGPSIATSGLVLGIDAANSKSYGPTIVEALVVAGGGGGGRHSGGGGGGGGLLYSSALPIIAGTAYSVTVGVGGASQYGVYPAAGGTTGANGGDSVFSILTAKGGGGGGFHSSAGLVGGSGGGSSRNLGAGAAATVNQGFAGGSSNIGTGGEPNYPAAGGGGAVGVGGSPSTTSGGIGGPGALYAISGTPTYYGGGGGGNIQYGAYYGGAGGIGGGGGGADGMNISSLYGFDGTANTGGGGGGAHYDAPATGAAGRESRGGTGVVIIRYPGLQKASGGTVTTADGYTIHTFTSVGSTTFTPGANWADMSGNTTVGTLTNGPSYSAANGGSVVFDGTNDYMDVTGNTNTRLQNGSQTVSMWININSVGPNGEAMIYNVSGGAAQTWICWTPGGVNFYCGSNVTSVSISSTNSYSQWMHVTYIIDRVASTFTLYKNGVYVNSVGFTRYTPSATTVQIGSNSRTGNAGDYTNGRISNIQLYNRTLSAGEILTNFKATAGRYISTIGSHPSYPAPSGYYLAQNYPTFGSGYYWIQSSAMPNPLLMYVDMSQEGGGYDFYPIEGGTSFSLYSDTHSGTALGLDYVYPRSKNHWLAMSNFVKNTLGYTGANYTRFFANVGKVYRTGGVGNYTSYPMRNPNYYGTGAPDWRVPDGGRWWLRDTAYSEPNGNYTLGGFLYFWQSHMLENYDLRDLLFDDAAAQPTGGYYLVSTNAKP